MDYARKKFTMDEIRKNVWIGDDDDAKNIALLHKKGITAILNVGYTKNTSCILWSIIWIGRIA